MANYTGVKAKSLNRSSGSKFSTLKGVNLDGGAIKGWRPFSPCICVTEPCPCDKLDDLIIWLPSTRTYEQTHQKVGGDAVVALEIDPDEELLVEVQVPMTIAQIKKLKEWSERSNGCGGTASGISIKKGAPVTPAKAAAAAFAVGFALGEKLDEETGLSDKISDWAADNIPWPF
jgi:hypothetical protein